jgi:hypothetical protein
VTSNPLALLQSLDLTPCAEDLAYWLTRQKTDAMPTMMPATPEQPRSAVSSLHLPNLLTGAVGSTTVANRSPASALLAVCSGLYAPQTCRVPACVLRVPHQAAREFPTQAAWRRHVFT